MTMISGYSKCGDVDSACELFDQVGGKDLLLFNAVIACYAQNSKLKEALKLFNMMLHPNVNVQPDEMTLASMTCGSPDSLNMIMIYQPMKSDPKRIEKEA
uniref:Pentatricopeptide repeat-containing protein n=1 Tax=Vitis vinifera TaxID=29760 RepID=F6GSY4_VITVI